MLKRTITALVAVIILLPILWFSDTYVLPVAIAIVTCIGLFEMFSCIGMKNKIGATLPAYFIGAIAPFIAKAFEDKKIAVLTLCGAMIIYILYLMMLAVLGHTKYSIHDLSVCYMSAVYVICGFVAIQFLREMSDYIYLLIFIGAWITDIFAYFTGMFFGKHKLCETISPKKTIEGSIGGTVFCAIGFVAFGIITSDANIEVWKYATFAAMGIVISIVSQIGDLSMSLIKRHYGIKDFGKIFPGHGGVLDRFDSIIAVSSILFVIIAALNALNVNIF